MNRQHNMTDEEFEMWLVDTIHGEEPEAEICSVISYSDAGILTMDRGLVIEMEDGSEFQVTIIKSR